MEVEMKYTLRLVVCFVNTALGIYVYHKTGSSWLTLSALITSALIYFLLVDRFL